MILVPDTNRQTYLLSLFVSMAGAEVFASFFYTLSIHKL